MMKGKRLNREREEGMMIVKKIMIVKKNMEIMRNLRKRRTGIFVR